jgi:chromate reductase
LNVPVMQQPEAYLGGAGSFFDADGKLNNDGTREFLATFAQACAKWIETNRQQ